MLITCQAAKDIDGVPTDVLVQVFADRILVLVTQLGKVGNLIQATMPVAEPLPPIPPADSTAERTFPPPSPSIQLTPLLGVAQSEHLETLHSIYASSIATLVWTYEAEGSLGGDRRAVIVGVALQKSSETAPGDIELTEHERKVFFGVMEVLRELLSRR